MWLLVLILCVFVFRNLLAELEDCEGDPQRVAGCFASRVSDYLLFFSSARTGSTCSGVLSEKCALSHFFVRRCVDACREWVSCFFISSVAPSFWRSSCRHFSRILLSTPSWKPRSNTFCAFWGRFQRRILSLDIGVPYWSLAKLDIKSRVCVSGRRLQSLHGILHQLSVLCRGHDEVYEEPAFGRLFQGRFTNLRDLWPCENCKCSVPNEHLIIRDFYRFITVSGWFWSWFMFRNVSSTALH